jgi:hypothetical protein
MNKEFVKYEQALALKELGFDEPCLAFYSLEKELHPVFQEPSKGPYFNNGNFIETLRVPLYQQAFRWFREKYDLNYVIVKAESWFYTINGCNTQEGFNTYEEAEQDCLDKLIEICKKK